MFLMLEIDSNILNLENLSKTQLYEVYFFFLNKDLSFY